MSARLFNIVNVDDETVLDPPRLLLYITLIIVISITSFLLAASILASGETVSILLFALCVLTLAILFRLFSIHKKGYVIKNGILSYPGGEIAAKSLSWYFSLEYYLQSFKRHEINLESIRSILQAANNSTIQVSGDFGTITLKFYSAENQSQLYSAIVSANKMGALSLRREMK